MLSASSIRSSFNHFFQETAGSGQTGQVFKAFLAASALRCAWYWLNQNQQVRSSLCFMQKVSLLLFLGGGHQAGIFSQNSKAWNCLKQTCS